ncbi:MAG: hypothetical protein ACFFBF_11005 [Promethearchaeota archaeon]
MGQYDWFRFGSTEGHQYASSQIPLPLWRDWLYQTLHGSSTRVYDGTPIYSA